MPCPLPGDFPNPGISMSPTLAGGFFTTSTTRKPNIYIAAAAAAKSLQSCLTLCDPIDGSPPGSPIPGILQARTLEWVAISFSNAWKWKVKVKSLSRVQLFTTQWTAAYQAPPSMGVLEWVAIYCLLLTYTFAICKIDRKWEFSVWHRELNPLLCDNLEGWDGERDRRGFRREGTFLYTCGWLDVWQKPTQYCKATILQFLKKGKRERDFELEKICLEEL